MEDWGSNHHAPAPTRTRRLACGAVLLLMLVASELRASTTVEVTDIYPRGDSVTLARGQDFYLHLHYSTDRPVHIWAQPYYHGKPARAGTNGSYEYNGDGEALGWFFLNSSADRVDEVRISAGDGSLKGTPVILTYPVRVSRSDQPARSEPPEWVSRLQARDAEKQKRAYEAYANRPISAGESTLFSVFMLGMLALAVSGFVMPVRAIRRWHGGWRVAATVPAAMMGFVVLRLILGVAADPTSHNLWPFEVLTAGLLSVAIMVVLKLLRRAKGEASP